MSNTFQNESMPLVSVVMSVYNGGDYLKEAIESILKQTFRDFEFIIINDGSTDKSLDVITAYSDDRIIILDQKNQGLAVSLNNGLKIAKGKYIARMDADDISMLNRLELQFKYLEEHPQCVVVGTNAEVIDKNGTFVFFSNLPITFDEIKNVLPHSPFYHSSVMMRKWAVEKAGFYFEPISKLYSFEDVILWNKLQTCGTFSNVKYPLIKYRLVPSAATTKSSVPKQVNDVMFNILKTGELSPADREILVLAKKQTSETIKRAVYYQHLGKKYLWNNYKPDLARKNLLRSLYYKLYSVNTFFLICLSFLPKSAVFFIYNKVKRF